MRRVRLAGVLAGALLLALPGAAPAASRFYRGPFANLRQSVMEVTARLAKAKPHRPTKLTRVEWSNVPASCGRFGTSATSGFFPVNVPVKAGAFSVTAKINGGRATVTLTGAFHDHNRSVSGKIRVKGTIPGCPVADTGATKWSAKPPGG